MSITKISSDSDICTPLTIFADNSLDASHWHLLSASPLQPMSSSTSISAPSASGVVKNRDTKRQSSGGSYTSQLQSIHSSAFSFACGDLSLASEADVSAFDSTLTAPLLSTWSWYQPSSASGPYSLPPMWNIGGHSDELFLKKQEKNPLWPLANCETKTSVKYESSETNETNEGAATRESSFDHWMHEQWLDESSSQLTHEVLSHLFDAKSSSEASPDSLSSGTSSSKSLTCTPQDSFAAFNSFDQIARKPTIQLLGTNTTTPSATTTSSEAQLEYAAASACQKLVASGLTSRESNDVRQVTTRPLTPCKRPPSMTMSNRQRALGNCASPTSSAEEERRNCSNTRSAATNNLSEEVTDEGSRAVEPVLEAKGPAPQSRQATSISGSYIAVIPLQSRNSAQKREFLSSFAVAAASELCMKNDELSHTRRMRVKVSIEPLFVPQYVPLFAQCPLSGTTGTALFNVVGQNPIVVSSPFLNNLCHPLSVRPATRVPVWTLSPLSFGHSISVSPRSSIVPINVHQQRPAATVLNVNARPFYPRCHPAKAAQLGRIDGDQTVRSPHRPHLHPRAPFYSFQLMAPTMLHFGKGFISNEAQKQPLHLWLMML